MCSSPSGMYTRVCHAGFFLLSFSLRARSSGKLASRSGCFFSSNATISRYVPELSKAFLTSRVQRARSSTGRTGLYPGGDGNGSGNVAESIVDVGEGSGEGSVGEDVAVVPSEGEEDEGIISEVTSGPSGPSGTTVPDDEETRPDPGPGVAGTSEIERSAFVSSPAAFSSSSSMCRPSSRVSRVGGVAVSSSSPSGGTASASRASLAARVR